MPIDQLPIERYRLKTITTDSRKLVKQIQQILSQRPRLGKETPLEQVVELLYQQRRYSSIGIYAVIGQKVPGLHYVPLAYRGPVLPCLEVAMGKSRVDTVAQSGRATVTQLRLQFENAASKVLGEVAVPIKLASRVLGVIDVESERLAGFGYRDQVLLKQVALLLARYLTSIGKAMIRKLRTRPRASADAQNTNTSSMGKEKKTEPASDRPSLGRKAIAGEMLHA